MTRETQRAGDEFKVILISREEDGETMDRDVRIQLTGREGYKKEKLITEEIVQVETVMERETVHSDSLPETENAVYTECGDA